MDLVTLIRTLHKTKSLKAKYKILKQNKIEDMKFVIKKMFCPYECFTVPDFDLAKPQAISTLNEGFEKPLKYLLAQLSQGNIRPDKIVKALHSFTTQLDKEQLWAFQQIITRNFGGCPREMLCKAYGVINELTMCQFNTVSKKGALKLLPAVAEKKPKGKRIIAMVLANSVRYIKPDGSFMKGCEVFDHELKSMFGVVPMAIDGYCSLVDGKKKFFMMDGMPLVMFRNKVCTDPYEKRRGNLDMFFNMYRIETKNTSHHVELTDITECSGKSDIKEALAHDGKVVIKSLSSKYTFTDDSEWYEVEG